MRPAVSRRSIVGICFVLVMLLGVGVRDGGTPAVASVDLLPNLEALPARDLVVEQTGGTTNLRLSVTTWNSGVGVMEVRAGAIDNQAKKQRVDQRIYASDGSFRDVFAGNFVWHQSHFHFHFEGYALYTLQPVGAPGGSSRIGSKTTFCIIDTDHIDGSIPGSPNNPVYNTCNNNFQGLSVGWGDTYTNFLAGQEIDITGLAAGDYHLTVEVDPNHRLEEGDETDNSSTILVRLDPAAGLVAVLPDADEDGVTDAEDNCPEWANPGQALPDWPVVTGDGDCDGFDGARETFLETDPEVHCAGSSTPSDEPTPDAWPVDFNDSQQVTTTDVGEYVPVLGERAPGPPYAVRYDLNEDGRINTVDVGSFVSFLGKSCTP
jgi:Lysyl oxidase/Thrombospondin type 3 repeat